MVIIRRNPDGSIANPDMVKQQTQAQNEQLQQQPVSHPALASKRGMQALQDVGRAIPPLMSEIATKINNCLLYTSPSPRDRTRSRMPSSA